MEAGIDEAGRGPVLGPLVVAGVAGDPQLLHEMGCRDSKLLTPTKRGQLARQIRKDAAFHVETRVIEAHVVDQEMAQWNLNKIEILRFRDIAQCFIERGCDRIVVDAADVNARRFGAHVAGGMPPHVDFLARHKADRDHPTVAAASIIAKVERDRQVTHLAKRLERRLPMEMGSGYPSDPKTKAFLAAWVEAFGGLPEGARRSWAPAKVLLAPRQASLPEPEKKVKAPRRAS